MCKGLIVVLSWSSDISSIHEWLFPKDLLKLNEDLMHQNDNTRVNSVDFYPVRIKYMKCLLSHIMHKKLIKWRSHGCIIFQKIIFLSLGLWTGLNGPFAYSGLCISIGGKCLNLFFSCVVFLQLVRRLFILADRSALWRMRKLVNRDFAIFVFERT